MTRKWQHSEFLFVNVDARCTSMIFYVHSHHGQEEKSTWMQLSQRVPMDEREYRRMEGSASRSLPVPNKGNDEIMRSDFPVGLPGAPVTALWYPESQCLRT